MRGGVLSKNIREGTKERRNENIIVSGTLKNLFIKINVSKSQMPNKMNF
jgi:hypothetical protein